MQNRKTPAPLPTRGEMLATFRRAIKNKAFLQIDAARALAAHQGQISKIMRGQFVHPKGLPARLFEYATIRLTAKHGTLGEVEGDAVGGDAESMRKTLTEHLMDAWDGTPDGARALAVILDGAARLRRLPQDQCEIG